MQYFETKLKIMIFYVFITFRDAYGGVRRDIGAVEISTRAQQKPLYIKCVERLEKSNCSREKTYLEHYLDVFDVINDDDEFKLYDERHQNAVNQCIENSLSILEDCEKDVQSKKGTVESTQKIEEEQEDQEQFDSSRDDQNNDDIKDQAEINLNRKGYLQIMFSCDLILMIYDLIKLQNTSIYCNIVENNQYYNRPDGILYCEKELERAGFIFDHGLDNYAYFKLKLSLEEIPTREHEMDKVLLELVSDAEKTPLSKDEMQDKVKEVTKKKTLTILQKKYIAYLIREITTYTKNNTNQGNTTQWCMCWECEGKLHEGGFKSRIDGRENYKFLQSEYGGNCDTIESKTRKDYCNYLKTNGKDAKFNLNGTLEWCKNIIE